jgi:murein DD-endopeptidase MepM/ murein hydrolase activator NlpD
MAKPATNSGGGGLLLVLAIAIGLAYAHNQSSATDGADGAAGAGAAGPPAAAPGGGRFVKPVDGRLTSGFGARWGTTHYGIDLAAPVGTPIRAVTDGIVIEAGPASGFGLWMRLRHADGTVTVYGHMNTIDRPAGAHVAAGEQIATVGSRGQSTGPHLHFEVWPHGDRHARIDPQPWLAQRGIHL